MVVLVVMIDSDGGVDPSLDGGVLYTVNSPFPVVRLLLLLVFTPHGNLPAGRSPTTRRAMPPRSRTTQRPAPALPPRFAAGVDLLLWCDSPHPDR